MSPLARSAPSSAISTLKAKSPLAVCKTRRLSAFEQAASRASTTSAKAKRTASLADFAMAEKIMEMSGLVRRRRVAPAVGTDLGDHQALGAIAVADEHVLTGAKLGDAEAAQSLHVYEDIGCALPLGEGPEAANAVEPFDFAPI